MSAELVPSEGVIRGVCPADGHALSEVAITPAEDVPAMQQAARGAQALWAPLSFMERGELLGRVRERFLADAERLVELMHDECGKPAAEAWTSEIVPDGQLFNYWINNAWKALERQKVSLSPIDYPGKSGVIELEPRGVIGLITPWNLPVAIPLRGLLPALMAGNAVLWKPSEHTPRVAAALHEHFEAELPRGLVTLVQGGGEQGAAIVQSGVDQVIFTGSVATGRKVATAAAERLIPAAVELGGKDAAIVLADADLERAAQGVVWGAFYNAGQNCASVERVYVERAVAEPFIARVREIAAGLGREQVGPLIDERQRSVVRAHVEQAVEAGARVLVGGPDADDDEAGTRYPPTVLVGVKDDMPVMREETFGPLLPIAEVSDAEEAVKRTNDSSYGLTASIWSRDTKRAEGLARQIEAGVIAINNHGFTGAVAQAPWCGVKNSGYGITNSPLAIREMVRPRFVLVDRNKQKRELWWYPYNQALVDVARSLTTLVRKNAGGKLAAVKSLLAGFLGRFK